MNEQNIDYLRDLISLLIEKADEAKNQQNTDEVFAKGRSMGLYESLDLIKQQAIAFGINLEKIGLQDVILENFL